MADGHGELVEGMHRYVDVIGALMAGLEAYQAKQVEALDDLADGMALLESVRIRDSSSRNPTSRHQCSWFSMPQWPRIIAAKISASTPWLLQ